MCGRCGLVGILDTSSRLIIFDKNDMEAPRPVRTQLDVLLYIRCAGRTGDEIDRPRQGLPGPTRAQPIPTILIAADQLIAVDDYDVGVRQKI